MADTKGKEPAGAKKRMNFRDEHPRRRSSFTWVFLLLSAVLVAGIYIALNELKPEPAPQQNTTVTKDTRMHLANSKALSAYLKRQVTAKDSVRDELISNNDSLFLSQLTLKQGQQSDTFLVVVKMDRELGNIAFDKDSAVLPVRGAVTEAQIQRAKERNHWPVYYELNGTEQK